MIICCDIQNENIQIGHSRKGAAATGIIICPMKESPCDAKEDFAEGLLIFIGHRGLSGCTPLAVCKGNANGNRWELGLDTSQRIAKLSQRTGNVDRRKRTTRFYRKKRIQVKGGK